MPRVNVIELFHYFRCPASNGCSGFDLPNPKNREDQDLQQTHHVVERAEPTTPNGCCDNLKKGQMCQPDCMRWIQNDETALPCEMGFYHKFKSDPETGIPSGCPGLDNDPKWAQKKRNLQFPECDKEDYAPEGEPLHSIVTEFAEDPRAWMDEFVVAFEKMEANGYGTSDLQDGPTEWFGKLL